jgi:hypothetical protein
VQWGTIYFENKLESPISFDQVRRHSDLTRRNPKCKLIFVSNIQHKNAALRSLPGYFHPTDGDHYVWVELLPAFDSYFRKNSLAANILTDFKTALKANGMIGRTIKGAKGSLYTAHSEASHLALRQLWDVLKELGYKLTKKSAHETTLRVYPSSYGGYPLLNPSFRATEADLDEAWDRECLEVAVLSKGDCIGLSRYLKKFCPTQDCAFLGPETSVASYTVHGWFVMPLRFVGRGTDVEIDFTRLTDSLQRVRIFLSKAPHFAALP